MEDTLRQQMANKDPRTLLLHFVKDLKLPSGDFLASLQGQIAIGVLTPQDGQEQLRKYIVEHTSYFKFRGIKSMELNPLTALLGIARPSGSSLLQFLGRCSEDNVLEHVYTQLRTQQLHLPQSRLKINWYVSHINTIKSAGLCPACKISFEHSLRRIVASSHTLTQSELSSTTSIGPSLSSTTTAPSLSTTTIAPSLSSTTIACSLPPSTAAPSLPAAAPSLTESQKRRERKKRAKQKKACGLTNNTNF